MNHRGFRTFVLVALSGVLLLLAGCRARPVVVTPTPPPEPTATSTPAPTATPVVPLPAGWVFHEVKGIGIGLPPDWEVLDLTQGNLEGLFAELQRTNPDLAKIVGSAEALQGTALWAFRAASGDSPIADNLNIRPSSLEGQPLEGDRIDVDPIAAQYRQLGFDVTESRSDLRVNGLPAAHLAYSYPYIGTDGKPAKIEAHQYLVASVTDIWILSYSAGPSTAAALAQVFEQSANSFYVKP